MDMMLYAILKNECKKEIDEAISGITAFQYEVVDELPAQGDKGVIYLVPAQDEQSQDIYNEYVWLGDKYEKIGAQQQIIVDAIISEDSENPVTSKAIFEALGLKQDIIDASHKLNATLVAGLATVATSGSYNDLIDKPTIPVVPTNISAFTNDVGYLTAVAWAQITDKPTFATVATSGSYNDLTDKPTIPVVPTNVSAFTNDAGYLTAVTWGDIVNKPTFAAVATSGDYDDLSNKPTIPVVPTNVGAFTNDVGYLTSVTWSEVTDKPMFADVATSGDYDDLSNKPTIPVVPTDVSAFNNDAGYLTVVAWNDVTNKPNFATVAISGDYNDLDNKPTIPVVPTDVSAFNNDVGYLTSVSWSIITGKPNFSTVAVSGSYNDLEDLPTIPTDTSDLTNGAGFLTTVGWTDVTDKPTFATVATSGSYNDLTDKPTIPIVAYPVKDVTVDGVSVMDGTTAKIVFPTNVSTFTNDAGYLTTVTWNDVSSKPTFSTVATSGDYNDLLNKPTIPVIPTNVSTFTNDAGYITNATAQIAESQVTNLVTDLQDIREIASGKTAAYTCSAITNPVLDTEDDDITVSAALTDVNGTTLALDTFNVGDNVYLLETDRLDRWVSTITKTGDVVTSITLSTLETVKIPVTDVQVNGTSVLSNTIAAITMPTKVSDLTNDAGYLTAVAWADVTNKPTFASVATSGSYADLSNKPTIPTDTSELTNGAGYITSVAWNDIADKPSFDNVAKTPLIETVPGATITIDPFKTYDFGVLSNGVVITLGTTGKVTGYCTEYCFRFTASTGCAITLPNTCKFANGNEITVFTEGHVYEYSIIDDLVAIGEFY